MKLLVATDIFGETPALVAWLTPIMQAADFTLELVSPYAKPFAAKAVASTAEFAPQPARATDELAYQQFVQHGGMNAYVEKLQRSFRNQQQEFIALGFSAGAAALWQLAAQPQPWFKQAYCFYGGQIRHCSELQPLISTTLIWAQETHFAVEQLHQQLQQRALVQSYLTSYPHGFINPHSAGFNPEAASYYQQWLIENIHTGAESIVNKQS
jgi:dienelactone hydrolase